MASNAFPLRSSLEPEFAIELDCKVFSVLAFFLPSLPLSLGLSTACSFFFSDFVCNFDVAVINCLYATVNSVWVVAVLKSVLASSKTVLRLLTLSSVLVAYVPLANFPSISLIKSVNSFLSRVPTFWGADSGDGLFSTFEGWVFVSTVAAGLVATVFPS